MKIEPISAQANRSGLKVPSVPARDVPTSTGATAAGSVRGRDATSQSRSGLKAASRALREPVEVRLSLFAVGVTALLRLLRHVEEEVGVVRELLEAGEAVLRGVEAGLQESQRERRQREHLAAPLDGLLLEPVERHHRVHEPHLERLLRVVLAAEEPDLLGLLRADQVAEHAGAETAVEAADLRPGLPEARVVGGDREVADHVQHVAAADRIARDHRHDRLRRAPHLHVQVGHVEAADPALGRVVLVHVARVAADALVAARAERERSLAGEDDHADVEVLARAVERVGDLDHRLRAERVADLRTVDRDLCDPLGGLVADVRVLARGLPVERRAYLLGLHGRAYDSHMIRAAAVLETAALKARQLAGLGVGEGTRVAVALPPSLEFAALLHAMPLLGSVLVPVNTRDPRQSVDADILIDAPLAGPESDTSLRGRADSGDTWVILHTSGTTAAPKPVSLTYANFRASAAAAQANLPLGSDDRWLCVLPLFHVGGLSILTRTVLYGASAIVHERFDPHAVREALESGEATIVSLVATMLRRLRAAGLTRAPALRAALVGGGPVPGDLLEWATGAGLPVIPTYGMTETCSQIATPHLLPGVEARTGAGGELLVRGPMVAPGAMAADGWLHTGDRGHVDAGGRLHVEGRIKDTIVSGGENVAAPEVEEALLAHPSVDDAAVVGRPDAEWGEVVVAYVVARDGVTDAELAAHCRERLAGYKVPRAFERVDELPRTASGKLLKGRLAA